MKFVKCETDIVSRG